MSQTSEKPKLILSKMGNLNRSILKLEEFKTSENARKERVGEL
jgi:hypothetical protein